jgi:3-deoxy-manno-octulosonate cytidylyltransferase (CMP-KDO synthetase)
MTKKIFHAIIPSRYQSTRFPGKPLVMLAGKPMFWHVWNRASACPGLSSVTLATDDERILRAAQSLGVPALMTSPDHASGTDRVYEAATLLGLSDDCVVVNIQGDEPTLDPEALSRVLQLFDDPSVRAATLAHPLEPAELDRTDKVKVVLAANGDALYFSRAGIPFSRDGQRARPALGHIGLYAFTMRALKRFVSLPPSSLELTEKLEQLRLLENGIPIRVALTDTPFYGVDREEDIAKVLRVIAATPAS